MAKATDLFSDRRFHSSLNSMHSAVVSGNGLANSFAAPAGGLMRRWTRLDFVPHLEKEEPVTDAFMAEAIKEAKQGRKEGGIPIGSVLVFDGTIIGRGHNQRVQKGSPILHAEMDCLQNAGRLTAREYAGSILYTTLSPCDMCSGAILLYGISKVVIGENRTFRGPESYLVQRGVELEIQDNQECVRLMEEFIGENPQLWNEDIGT
jgi:creatinine deaminase